jgi:ABC-2 type transport system ATP-binding protein
MRRTALVLPVAALAVAAATVPAVGATHSHPTKTAAASKTASKPGYSKQTLDFTVTVKNEALIGTGTQKCLIVGDLFKPANASPHHRVPVILTTNGFGGSKNDQDNLGAIAAQHGYGVLSYSGLGFGGSGCKISLDDPSYDGVAGKQLVSFLGGKTGIAKTTSGAPVKAINWIEHDKVAHNGKHEKYDPRVGMIGGSYGGEIQFAVAGLDPRLDAIIPIITWNDLSYSLAPNDTAQVHGVTYSEKAPGTAKYVWVEAFFGLGIADGVQGGTVDPAREVGCPNFITEACKADTELLANEIDTPDLFDFARHASVENYMKKIKIPTLLMQGQGDTLFNLQEATATYRSLRKQHTPVKMIWQSWGHSVSTPQPGEWIQGKGVLKTYEGQRVFAWFDHYLKGEKVSTGPRFAYYRDYVPFKGKGPDTVQYGTSSHFPAGKIKTFYASGSSSLVSKRSAVKSGSVTYSNFGGPTPLSFSELSAVNSDLPSQATTPRDTAGSFAAWSTPALKQRIDLAGIPTATLHVTCANCSSATTATELQLFAKIYDVAPNGSINLVRRLVAPVRVLDASKAIHVSLPGIVHRFAKGHRLELVIAATDSGYRNANVVQLATASTSHSAPITLHIPVVK